MLKLPRALLLCAALTSGFASVAHAQLLTSDTIGGSYINIVGLGSYLEPLNGMGVTQTFSNITSIDTLTVRFGTSNNTFGSPIDLNIYFSEWTGSAATSILGSTTLSLTAPNTWIFDTGAYYFDATVDFTAVAGSLDNSTTYGFTVVGSGLSNANSIGIFQGQTAYADGSVFVHNAGNPITSGADINHSGSDFAFIGSSIVASNGSFSPVPEASTIAVLFAGLFVGGLAYKRVRDRRQAALVTA
jgi:hypothetical protein